MDKNDFVMERDLMKEFNLISPNGKKIHCVCWEPNGPVHCVVQIVHGIAEYINRYENFAKYLNQFGILVTGEDHMGHGRTLEENDPKGYFYGGWNAAVDNVYTLMQETMQHWPNVPYVILGHSMGSFLTRTLLYRYPDCGLSGAVICGTGWQAAAVLKAGLAMARSMCRKIGETQPSPALHNMFFGPFNRKISSPRTPSDWICSDPAVVDAYTADPLCSFCETVGLERDMLQGIQMNQKKENLANMSKKLPVLFIAGTQDPVGSYGKGVRKSAEAFRKAGMLDVETILYANSRHEILNDVEKDQVYADIHNWIEKKIL